MQQQIIKNEIRDLVMKWYLLIFDVFLLSFISITIYTWNEKSDFKKFMHGIICVLFIIQQLVKHVSLYKKERRLY